MVQYMIILSFDNWSTRYKIVRISNTFLKNQIHNLEIYLSWYFLFIFLKKINHKNQVYLNNETYQRIRSINLWTSKIRLKIYEK